MHRYCHSLGVHFVDKNATDWHLDLGCVLSWFQTITLDQSPFGLIFSQFLLNSQKRFRSSVLTVTIEVRFLLLYLV